MKYWKELLIQLQLQDEFFLVFDHQMGGGIGHSMGAFCERFSDVCLEYINDNCPSYHFDNY